jgi:hypothetical protein
MAGADRPVRRLRRVPSALAACVVTLLALVALPPAHAVFSDTTGNAANLLAADRLAPPSGLSVTQTCSVPPAVAFRSATTAAGTDSLTLPVPTGTVAGDVLLAQVVHPYTTTAALSAPTGWVRVRNDSSSTVLTSALYRRTAVTGEPSATFTFPAGSGIAMVGGVAAYSGVSTTTPIDASAAAGGYGTTPYTPAVTTTTADTMVVRFIANSTTSFPEPAGTTLRWRFPESGTTATGVTASDELFVGPGTAPQRDSVAQSTTSSYGVGQTVALRRTPSTPSAVLSWTATPSSWATGYRGQRLVGEVLQGEQSVPSRTTTTATDPNLVNGTTYTYRIWAYRGTWTSEVLSVPLTASC